VRLQGDQTAGPMAKQFAIALILRCLGLLLARSKPYMVQTDRQKRLLKRRVAGRSRKNLTRSQRHRPTVMMGPSQ
jgi:hypothetical protein